MYANELKIKSVDEYEVLRVRRGVIMSGFTGKSHFGFGLRSSCAPSSGIASDC